MSKPHTHNSEGAPIEPEHGYVICQVCQQPVSDISKETRPAYAYHVDHRPWNHAAAEREQKRQEFFESKKKSA